MKNNDLSSEIFTVEQEGHIATVTMIRPQKVNSMVPAFWTELPQIVRTLNKDKNIRVMILKAEGKHFSAGMDLSVFEPLLDIFNQEPGRAGHVMYEQVQYYQATFNALEEADFPVIAAVQGACVGGGIDMITACDIRLATQNAFFSIEEVNIGMVADVGTLQRLPKIIPAGIARDLALTGRRFTAAQAEQWGLVSETFADVPALHKGAQELAQRLAEKSPLALSGIKKTVNYARDHSVSEGLEQIATWNAGMLRPEDLMRAIQAKTDANGKAAEDANGKAAEFDNLAGI